MANWQTVKTVPWNSHELEPHTGNETIEINFDHVEAKIPHLYLDCHGTERKGTIITTVSGLRYILHDTPDQYLTPRAS